MPGKGSNYRKNSSNKRGGHGQRGRGRGRGSFRNNTAQFQSHLDFNQYQDDFRIYGQFSSDEEDSNDESNRSALKKKSKNKQNAKFQLKKQNRPPLETSYTENTRNFSASQQAKIAENDRFAKGKSKYYKTVLFQKSTTVLNSNDDEENLVKSISEMNLNSTTVSDRLLWDGQTSDNKNSTTLETINYDDLINDSCSSKNNKFDKEERNDDVDIEFEKEATREEDKAETSSSEYSSELLNSDGEELLEEDILVMQDYLEHIELEEDENIQDLLSLMVDENIDIDDSFYDYGMLDGEVSDDSSDEENHIIRHATQKNRQDDTVVDPEIFSQTLKAALADVPPGLRPGMRKWYEKQQRKEQRKKRKEESKALKKSKKGKNSGKSKEPEDISNQILKIDERIRFFIMDDSINSYQFAPMDANIRRQIHVLAATYNLKSKSGGTGLSRCTVVTKTNETFIPRDRRFIERFILDTQNNIDEQNRIIAKNRSPKEKSKKKYNRSSKPKKKQNNDNNDGQKAQSHGTIVAFNAPPINEENIGHRMLAAMGWKQGDTLGTRNDGITAPIEAIIRKKNRGLGL